MEYGGRKPTVWAHDHPVRPFLLPQRAGEGAPGTKELFEMKTDIQIAQESRLLPISEVAAAAGIDGELLEHYGRVKAKIDTRPLRDLPRKGRLILVTAINPTPAGEGKTTTSVGLSDALRRLGKNTILCLREPSLGPVFGIKGGAAGGGYAQVVPMEDINLHFTGDFHAIGAANNLLAAMIDNHIYQGNELNRSGNLLRYLVVHQLPTYQDKLLLDMDEVADIHRSIANVITKDNDNAHVITTFGDAHVETIAESDTTLADALAKAYAAVFNDAGFNSAIFTADSVQSLAYSILRDKNYVWYFVKSLAQFYTIAVNNYFDFKNYQADIEILPISPYTYNEDIERYRSNATLGINKIDLIIASGIKQKHIQDNFALEDYLHLERIKPLATSYTQTADGSDTTSTDADADNGIEPSTSDETASTADSITTEE